LKLVSGGCGCNAAWQKCLQVVKGAAAYLTHAPTAPSGAILIVAWNKMTDIYHRRGSAHKVVISHQGMDGERCFVSNLIRSSIFQAGPPPPADWIKLCLAHNEQCACSPFLPRYRYRCEDMYLSFSSFLSRPARISRENE
jgi:hypothetical protein